MLPNFLVVGAAKSGTTSLYHYLGQHPDIYVSPVKEPDYFSFMDQPLSFIGPGNQALNGGIITDAAEYRGLFRGVSGEKAVGECSTSYLFIPQAAGNIRRTIPDCRIIIILRQPAGRAFSHYLDHLRTGQEPLSFEQALAAEPDRAEDNWRWGYQYAAQSRYYEQVQRFYRRFDSRRIAVYLFDDLLARPIEMMQAIYRFLEVDADFVPDVRTIHHPGGRPRSPRLQRLLVQSHRIKQTLKPLVPPGVWSYVRGNLVRLNLKRTSLSPDTRTGLTELFREDIRALEGLIDKDLSSWLA